MVLDSRILLPLHKGLSRLSLCQALRWVLWTRKGPQGAQSGGESRENGHTV